MPVGTEVANYIASSTAGGFTYGLSTSTGTPVWLNKLPDSSPPTSVLLLDSGGPGPLYTQTGISIERPTLQLISRSTSYAVAKANADFIYTLLGSVTNSSLAIPGTTGTTRYASITPLQSPNDMGQDSERRSLVGCNFITEREP